VTISADPAHGLDDVAVVVTNYNGGEVLVRTLETVQAVLGEQTEVIVVDDGSEDGSLERVAHNFPGVRVVSPGGHTARMNVVRNQGLRAATKPYVFLIDNDIQITPGCVDELKRAFQSDRPVLCATPRLLDADDPDRIYSDGNQPHFLGLSGASKRNRPVSETPVTPPRPTFGGGIMLINRERAAELDYFDEGYALGWADDAEFQLRGRARGFQALHVPSAVCLHSAKDHAARRSYGQFYNRFRLLFTVYSVRSLILLSPILVLFELGLTGAAVAMGVSRQRFSAMRQIWRDQDEIRTRRRQIQSHRQLRDSELLSAGGVDLAGPMGRTPGLPFLTRIATGVLNGYWWLVRRWI
jgi:GT2 family glycosyltransferase